MRSIRGADGQAAAKSSLADIEKRKKGIVFSYFFIKNKEIIFSPCNNKKQITTNFVS